MEPEQYAERVERFLTEAAKMIKGEMEKIPYELAADITSQMKFTQPAGGAFRTGKKLGVETGDLSRALLPGKPGNIYTLKGNPRDAFEVDYGIDPTVIRYALIQELGGFIRHKGKMPGYLFHLARETGLEKYRIIAISAKRKGGVNIKARPYFGPGVRQYEKSTWPKKLQRMDEQLSQIWARTAA